MKTRNINTENYSDQLSRWGFLLGTISVTYPARGVKLGPTGSEDFARVRSVSYVIRHSTASVTAWVYGRSSRDS